MIRGISVVYLYVSDMARSLAFYRDLLGVPLEADPGGGWAEAAFPGGTRFALHLAHDEYRPVTPNSVCVSLVVPDVDEAVERLRAEGVEAGEIFREPWGTQCEVVDPDGYTIGLFTPPR